MKNTGCLLLTLLLLLIACEKDPSDNSSDIPNIPNTPNITIITGKVSNVTCNSANVSSTLSDTYGLEVSDYGHCWDSLPEPTVVDCKTGSGASTTGGDFNSVISELQPNQKYYVRSYFAIDSDVVYGESVSFTTKDGIPFLSTTEVTKVTTTTAISGGNIIDDGGDTILARGVCWNTTGTPSISDSKTTDSSGTGSYISSLTGLTESTIYSIRSYATTNYGTGYGQQIDFTTDGPVTDYDGNIYNTVRLGNQLWMAENLRVTHYPDGSAISLVSDFAAWGNLGDNNTDDAYCFYNNNSNSEYGALYNYAAAINACPSGWHLPSDAEWTELENYLADNGYNYDGSIGGGGDKIAKAISTASGWNISYFIGSVGNNDYPDKQNESGFSALPGGYRSNRGSFRDVGYNGTWWGAAENSTSNVWRRVIYCDFRGVYSYVSDRKYGFSVRCVNDN